MLIVIDALRLDFVISKEKLNKMQLNWKQEMPKLEEVNNLLAQEIDAIAFVTQVHSPTVTLPRIKVSDQ